MGASSRTDRRALIVLLAIGIVAGTAMRWIAPSADPPLHRQTGAYWWEEVWSTGARNAVVHGTWSPDDYQPWVAGPLHTALVAGSLRVFGMNAFGWRFMAMFSGTTLLLLAYAQGRAAGLSRRASWLAVYALAASWTMVGFSRCILLEPTLLLFFSISVWLTLLGARARRHAWMWYAGAGACAGLGALCKTSGLAMSVPVAAYLLLGCVPSGGERPWGHRFLRTAGYGAGLAVVFGAGFAYWIAPEYEAFRRLVLEVSLVDRAQTTLFMRAYKAVTWLDSQAFIAAPALLAATALILPRLCMDFRRISPECCQAQRFALGLCLASVLGGIALMIHIDVPARRLVYVNLFAALLAGMAWDWLAKPSDTNTAPQRGITQRAAVLAACAFAAFVLAGWLVSPNGGLLSLVAPELSAWVLFTMRGKVAYKCLWLALGGAGALSLYAAYPTLMRRTHRLAHWAVAAHLGIFLVAALLWSLRMSHTVHDASRGLAGRVPPGAAVLGSDAAALGYGNDLRLLFWSPRGYLFANHDEGRIAADHAPRFLLINDYELSRIAEGRYPISPYVQSFLANEIDRFPIYELHDSTRLRGDYVLFERRDAPETP